VVPLPRPTLRDDGLAAREKSGGPVTTRVTPEVCVIVALVAVIVIG